MDTLLPTTKHRRGRRTPRQERALAAPGEALVALADLSTDSTVTGRTPLVLDVGFGSGEAVVALAEADPDATIIAVDMHTPGIGDLLASISERDLHNVRVVEADVRHVLAVIPAGRLSGARTFFPDPWPKKRHHRRRLSRRPSHGSWHSVWPSVASGTWLPTGPTTPSPSRNPWRPPGCGTAA